MQKKESYISLARILSAYAVIVLHTNFCSLEYDFGNCWFSGNFIDCFTSFAVPVFLMISGATLMDYSDRYSTKEYLKKRFFKTVIPFVAWILISKITGMDVKIWMTFLFFSFLFGVYLVIPVFSFINKEMRMKIIEYVVIVSFLINYLMPFIESITNTAYFRPLFEIGQNYLIYALVGYLLHKNNISIKMRLIIYTFALIGLGVHVFGTYFATLEAGVLVETFKGYTRLPGFLQYVGMFLLIKDLGSFIKNDKICGVLDWISGYTFPIFFLHVYIINIIPQLLECNTHSLVYRLGAPVLNFVICMVITWIIRKIPIIKRIVP